MLFCFVVYALFCIAISVEARLSVGFSLSFAEVFPWHIVWAHKCLNLVLCCVSTNWPLAVSLAISILCLTFVTYHNYALTVCMHELFDTDKLINIDIMNFPRFHTVFSQSH